MGNFTGRFINKQTADDEINMYIRIRDKSYNDINNSVAGIVEPDVPFKDAMIAHFKGKETSFIFDKSTIRAFITLLEEGESNALRIYLGARPLGDPEPTVTKGSRTLVIVPAKVSYDKAGNITDVENNIFNNVMAAMEYPGGVITELHEPDPINSSKDPKPGAQIVNIPL